MVTAIGEPSPTHCAPPKKVSKAPRSARSSAERPPRRLGSALAMDEEDVEMSERPKETRCCSRTWLQKSPKEPRHVSQHERTTWIWALACTVAVASASSASRVMRVVTASSPTPAPSHVLQRAEREHDRVGEVLEHHVGVQLAQLDDEVAEGVGVASPLRPRRRRSRGGPSRKVVTARPSARTVSGLASRGVAGGRPTGRCNEGSASSSASRSS